MKIRQGFVSNSSSQSFIVVGKKPPIDVESARLNLTTARKVIQRAIEENQSWRNDTEQLAALQAINPEKDKIWLTQFLSDAGDYTDPLVKANAKFYHYCDGGHSGPYDEESFVNIGGEDQWGGVWVQNEDFVKVVPPKGQLELPFDEMD